jgi:hypothetical protein
MSSAPRRTTGPRSHEGRGDGDGVHFICKIRAASRGALVDSAGRIAGERKGPAPGGPWNINELLPQGLHPADASLSRRLRLLHLYEGSKGSRAAVSATRGSSREPARRRDAAKRCSRWAINRSSAMPLSSAMRPPSISGVRRRADPQGNQPASACQCWRDEWGGTGPAPQG